jgi:hypothetical protein
LKRFYLKKFEEDLFFSLGIKLAGMGLLDFRRKQSRQKKAFCLYGPNLQPK